MMDCLYIFLFMLHFSAGCDMDMVQQTLEVTGYSGGSVVLPCSCTEPQDKPHQLIWTYHQGDYKELYPSEHIERYKNRVTLLNQTTPGDLSLLLSSLTKEDDGDYQCYVSSDQYTYIRLHVKGCDMDMVRQTLEVTGYSGGSVLLPCSCTDPQTKPHQLKWTYHQGDYKEFYPSEHIERYKNRVTLLNQTTPGDLSLRLSSLTKEDVGVYQCYVSSDQYTYIRLHVKGCDMDMVRQTLEVTGYSGGSVVLPCSCTEPQTKPHQLKWTYHQGNYTEIYPSEHIERYKNRVTLLNQTTPGNLSLRLSSLTKEDDGDYQCYVSSDQYTYIRLCVKEKPHVNTNKLSTSKPLTTRKQTPELINQPTENMPQYVFILMGVFALVLLLALLAFIYWRWKGGKNVKVTRDDPEIVREPNNEPSTSLYEPKKEASTHLYEPINEDDVTYSAVVHVKRSSTPASTQNDKVDDTEYASVNVKQT
ncbi:cell surface A33 antigen isoform X2 [Triplophysa dalaica]|uniref:cell surface A33 antigen isoform X2 n=1 Tax=Triplophysa dalaica TaxID=1582913 RepID=UPI0024DFF66F|nr:cell surface A33 antigen isoform X2 [Triplophysa dalaica]